MQQNELEFKELPINADRFCEGISKIGYKPAAAIMDIVDNSVAAGATAVEIELVTRAGTTNSAAGNVECFRIYDNGVGMHRAQIETALEIGSDVVYPDNSLSKFGLGLKSAGFSLGRRIEVASQATGAPAAAMYVDRDIIRERAKYGVCAQEVSAHIKQWLEKFNQGTVVGISKTAAGQDSAAKIRRELERKLGVTYFQFLSRIDRPLNIVIRIGNDTKPIKPLDLLFWSEAADRFDPDHYDAKLPCKVYEGTIDDDLFAADEKITLKIAIFPMDKMKGYPGFSPEEKQRIAGYLINRENNGFFFYRNGRLIRWGDKIAGVGRDDIGFRAQVDFSTAHDDLFHVDVSKQNLESSEDFEHKLDRLCERPLADAAEAFALCKRMMEIGTGNEGEAFNERTEVFEESDPMEEFEAIPPEVKDERRAILEHETREREIKEGVEPGTEAEGLPDAARFERIRYSDAVMGLDVAVPGTDRSEGTYVRINRNHPFYHLVINFFEASTPERIAIEALLFAGAVAETKTCENFRDLPLEQLRRVFTHFRRVFSQNLDAWANSNQDVFE